MELRVRLGVSWRRGRRTAAHVVEVVTPRTNLAALTSAENLLASIALAEPFSLEIATDSAKRRFLVRAGSEQVRDQLSSQLAAAYPQADVRRIERRLDPAYCRPGELIRLT